MQHDDLQPDLGRKYTPQEAAWSKELKVARKQLHILKKSLADDLTAATNSSLDTEKKSRMHGENMMRQVIARWQNLSTRCILRNWQVINRTS